MPTLVIYEKSANIEKKKKIGRSKEEGLSRYDL